MRSNYPAGPRRRARLSPLLLLAAASACAAPSAGSREAAATDPAGRAVTGDALRKLLSDAYVVASHRIGVKESHSSGEVFRANGGYERITGRTRLRGMFEIENDAVCLYGGDLERHCRKVRQLGPDTYLFINISGGSTAVLAVTPL
jgi:hypothetical protein